ncbi:5231_t:CDS:2 [Scutellospora calospora]|uniref:5231_t:CDS:1 n=1 Tax=Scutellospora calospora TaxID=85575 RepID=A0ACA9K0D4_9GLOM|nr:5231_t:CDS:2 [Scutellospora calospora]
MNQLVKPKLFIAPELLLYIEVFQVYREFQSMLYSLSFIIYDNYFDLNEENNLLLLELQYISVDQSNQIETEDNNNETRNIIHWCFEYEYSGNLKQNIILIILKLNKYLQKKHSTYSNAILATKKTKQKIYINKLIEEHNYSLIPYHEEFALSLQ